MVTSLHRDFLPSSWGGFAPTLWDVTTLAGDAHDLLPVLQPNGEEPSLGDQHLLSGLDVFLLIFMTFSSLPQTLLVMMILPLSKVGGLGDAPGELVHQLDGTITRDIIDVAPQKELRVGRIPDFREKGGARSDA